MAYTGLQLVIILLLQQQLPNHLMGWTGTLWLLIRSLVVRETR